jgi:hypothetical protein
LCALYRTCLNKFLSWWWIEKEKKFRTRSPILQQEEFRSLISAIKIIKTLPGWEKRIRVLWNYVKNSDTSVKDLCFILECCDCRSNYEYDIGNLTSWTVFLIFHFHICCFISRSEVMFPCGIIVVEVWNSTYVVLIVNCVFILKIICFLSFMFVQS